MAKRNKIPSIVESKHTYHTPGNYIPGGASNGLFCTTAQAEAAGFTHSLFDGVK